MRERERDHFFYEIHFFQFGTSYKPHTMLAGRAFSGKRTQQHFIRSKSSHINKIKQGKANTEHVTN